MLDVVIVCNAEEVQKDLLMFAEKTPLVIARAANRAAVTVRKTIRQEVAARYYIQPMKVDAVAGNTERASAGKPYAKISYKDGFYNLAKWAGGNGRSVVSPFREIVPYPISNPKFYKARIKKGSGFKPLNAGDRKPFMRKGEMLGRTGDSAYPLWGFAGPAIPQLVKNNEVVAAFSREGGQMMQRRLIHEVSRILNGG